MPKDDDVLTVGMNRAMEILSQESKGRGRGQAAPGKELGKDPASGETVTQHEGRYGPYVKLGKVNATIPGSIEPASLTLDQALSLIAAPRREDRHGRRRQAEARRQESRTEESGCGTGLERSRSESSEGCEEESGAEESAGRQEGGREESHGKEERGVTCRAPPSSVTMPRRPPPPSSPPAPAGWAKA